MIGKITVNIRPNEKPEYRIHARFPGLMVYCSFI